MSSRDTRTQDARGVYFLHYLKTALSFFSEEHIVSLIDRSGYISERHARKYNKAIRRHLTGAVVPWTWEEASLTRFGQGDCIIYRYQAGLS